MRIACDNQVARDTIESLERCGFSVVYWAGDEHDEWWFREAVEVGAEVFISPDWDIAALCNRYDKGYVQLPQKVNHHRQAGTLIKKLRSAENHKEKFGRYP